jgi:hypothetical protein
MSPVGGTDLPAFVDRLAPNTVFGRFGRIVLTP